MKKIPTLYKREFKDHRVVGIIPEYTDKDLHIDVKYGLYTVKFDGSCCAIIDGVFYKRFDAKPGRTIPEGAIPCCDCDPITGHHPHWVECDPDNKADKWFFEALKHYDLYHSITDKNQYVTFEAIGQHFNGNPYEMDFDTLVPHGIHYIPFFDSAEKRNFAGISEYLVKNNVEGIVIWRAGSPVAKIKRTDFGLDWR